VIRPVYPPLRWRFEVAVAVLAWVLRVLLGLVGL